MLEYLLRHGSAISFTVVVAGFLINLLLAIFVYVKKEKNRSVNSLAAMFFLCSFSMLYETLSYVSAISGWGVFSMRVLTVMGVSASAFVGFFYYKYLLDYYADKENKQFPRIYTVIPLIYTFAFCIIFALLSTSGILFDVTADGRYAATEYSLMPIIALVPLMIGSFYAAIKGRKLTEGHITFCFILGIILTYAGAAIDGVLGISVNYLWRTLLNLVLFNVLMYDQESELRKAMLAEQTIRARSTFLTNMSHDLRTPMNAILGFTELAKKDTSDSEKIDNYLEKISDSGKYLLSLINDVLEMSRIENSGIYIEENPVDLSKIIDEINTMISARTQERNQTFLPDSSQIKNRAVLTDELRLKQVLTNILGNAVKYTDKGGNISFSIKETDTADDGIKNYVFVVKDNGIGMSEEFQNHIFEAFSRERSSTVSGKQGTGLGMAITANLVRLMNGTIEVESEQGKGSKFTVSIPFRLCDESKIVTEENQEIVYDFCGKRILLVEDNEINRIIALEILKDKNLIVDVAVDGRVAVDMIMEKAPDYYRAILMDIQMPVMDGYEATQAIREMDGARSQLPVIAMSANAFKEDIDKAMEAGMDDYVIKPIVIDDLFHTLSKYMG